MESKIYFQNGNDITERYMLGTFGRKPIICIGVNPSIATTENLDPTIKKIQKIAGNNGYDSFIMFNLYPQRATNPDDLHRTIDRELSEKNINIIKNFINYKKYTIWLAWGSLIYKRAYLIDIVQELINSKELINCEFVCIGEVLKDGHPRHPLYVKNTEKFKSFNPTLY